ncbi:MAG: DUF350 domain-containing protein [Bacteroidia bacterium]|nr:DUF350 domain-containing protein [Bacteroidia bacterium]
MEWFPSIEQAGSAAAYVLLYIAVFFLAKWIKSIFVPYRLDEQLTEHDNVAVAVSLAGYIAGVTAIFAGAVWPSGGGGFLSFWEEFALVAAYALGGVLLLNLARILNDRLMLHKFSVERELIRDQNPGTGLVEAAAYLASGLIIGGAIHGEGGGPVTALVFFALGQAALLLFGWLYARLSPYNLHAEIEDDNTAAGAGFAGGLISIGLIVMHAVAGNFSGWAEDLAALGLDLLLILVYLAGVRLIIDRFFLRRSNLQTEIARDRNLGVGLLEMVASVGFALVLILVI